MNDHTDTPGAEPNRSADIDTTILDDPELTVEALYASITTTHAAAATTVTGLYEERAEALAAVLAVDVLTGGEDPKKAAAIALLDGAGALHALASADDDDDDDSDRRSRLALALQHEAARLLLDVDVEHAAGRPTP